MTIDIKMQTEAEAELMNADLAEAKPIIAVIGGEPSNVLELKSRLSNRFTLRHCHSAEDALSYLDKSWRTIDLVILYDTLPDINNLDFLKVLRVHPNFKHLKVILCGNSCKDVEATFAPDHCIGEFYSEEEIKHVIETALRKRV